MPTSMPSPDIPNKNYTHVGTRTSVYDSAQLKLGCLKLSESVWRRFIPITSVSWVTKEYYVKSVAVMVNTRFASKTRRHGFESNSGRIAYYDFQTDSRTLRQMHAIPKRDIMGSDPILDGSLIMTSIRILGLWVNVRHSKTRRHTFESNSGRISYHDFQ